MPEPADAGDPGMGFPHYCHICETGFQSFEALATHDCEEPADVATDGGEGLTWGQPDQARKWHVFDGLESLCGSWGFYRPSGDAVDPETDDYDPDRDCTECAQKAGLDVPATDGGTSTCELCGTDTDSLRLTSDSHPEGPNLMVCPDCSEVDVATDGGRDGTLILADEPRRSLQWHHSVEFDGFAHTTACGRTIDTDHVRDVELDPDTWSETVPPADGCGACSESVREIATDGGWPPEREAAFEANQQRAEAAERQADALEEIAEELRYQNAVLAELVMTLHYRAVDEGEPVPSVTAVHTSIDDHRVTRQEADHP